MRIPTTRALAATLVAGGAVAVLLPAASANAMNPCDSYDPPDTCWSEPPATTAPAPAAPTNLSLASVLQSSVTLQWTDNSTTETAWRVKRDMVVGNTSTTTYFQPDSTSGAGTGTATWTDTSVTPGASVYYRVSAVNGSPSYDIPGYSAAVGPAGGRTKPAPANPVVSPTYGAWDESSTAIWIHGTAVDWDTTAPIQVLVWHDGAAEPTTTANAYASGFNQQNPGYGDNHGYSLWMTKKAAKGVHRICVQAVNVGGGTAPAPSCRSYTVYGPPSAATNVTATVGASTVTVRFRDNADDETGWFLQRSTDGQASWYAVGNQQPAIAGTGGTGTATDYSTPAAGTCYRILTVNTYGQTASAPACTP